MTLPKPYFETELGKLYNADCLEIMPLLEPVDLVLTDPPYGMDYQSAWRSDRSKWKPKINGDKKFPMELFNLKPCNAMFVFCRWDNLKEIPKPTSLIVWDKLTHSMGDLKHEFGRQWEAIAFYPGPEHSFLRRPADIIRCPKVPAEKLLHPAQKPTGVYYPLLKTHLGTVLDPYLGSGTTALACEHVKRKWIGIEIEERYCRIARDRIERECKQLKLF